MCFFVVCLYGPLYTHVHVGGKRGGRKRKRAFRGLPILASKVPMSGGKGGGRKQKKRFRKRVFFRGLPILASKVPMSGAREEAENKKNTFSKAGFFRGLPKYGPLKYPCRGQGGGRKRKRVFFRGLPIKPLNYHPQWAQKSLIKEKNLTSKAKVVIQTP